MNFGRRLQNRFAWFLIALLVSAGSILISLFIKKKFPSFGCENFRDLGIYVFPILIALVLFIVILFLPEKKEPSLVGALGWLVAIGLINVIIPFFGTEILLKTNIVRERFCSGEVSAYSQTAQEAFSEGDYRLAEEFAEKSLILSKAPEDVLLAERLLAMALTKQLDQAVDADNCELAQSYLEKIDSYSLVDAGRGGEPYSGEVYQLEKQTFEICNKTVATYRISIVGQSIAGDDIIIDFKVFRDNNFAIGWDINNIKLTNSQDELLKFEFAEINLDDPACFIPVIDNSVSSSLFERKIRTGLDNINRDTKLNDRLGMIVFGGKGDYKITKPGLKDLNLAQVNSEGKGSAIFHALEESFKLAESCNTELIRIILVSDGQNTEEYIDSSNVEHDCRSAADLISNAAKNLNIQLCTIGIPTEFLDPIPLKILPQNCDYFPAGDDDEIPFRFDEILSSAEREFYRVRIAKELLASDKIIKIHLFSEETNDLVEVIELVF